MVRNVNGTRSGLAILLAILVISAMLILSSGTVSAHPPEDAWNEGPHCHTQTLGLLEIILTFLTMFLGVGFVMLITPMNIDCHGGGPVEV